MQVFKGIPSNLLNINKNEAEIYKVLDKLGIDFSRVDHEAVHTMEDCYKIDALIKPAKHCKNLFLCPVNKSKYYMLVMEENKKFASSKISRQINSSRLQFATDEELFEILGLKPGSVGVLSLLQDTSKKVQLLVDEDILATEYIASHPGVNTATVALKTNDLFTTYLQYVDHDYIIVKCE